MELHEIEALRKAADEIWEIARDLSNRGFELAAEEVRTVSAHLHERASMSSLPPAPKKLVSPPSYNGHYCSLVRGISGFKSQWRLHLQM